MYSRNTIWTTFDGRKIRVKDMADSHIANLIMFLTNYAFHPAQGMIPVLREEARRRGLTEEFLTSGPYPHESNGQAVIWDYDENQPVRYNGGNA